MKLCFLNLVHFLKSLVNLRQKGLEFRLPEKSAKL